MKKDRIISAVMATARVIDRPPVCYITVVLVTAIIMAACGWAYNDVCPAYQ